MNLIKVKKNANTNKLLLHFFDGDHIDDRLVEISSMLD